jgi:putative salt-induced outer membrane protein YdiY
VRAAALVVVTLLCAVPELAHAQIVNVQGLVGQDLPEGFSGQLDASGDWRTGNTELILVSGAATLRYKAGDHLVFAMGKGAYARVRDDQIIGNVFEHLRYRWTLTPRWTAEAFAQHELDQFRRLQLRALVGAGPRVTLADDERAGLIVGVAYMFETEEYDDKAGTTDAGATFYHHRLSSYVLFTSALNEVVSFAETVYFQPKIDDAQDFRVLNETLLQVKLNDRFSFKTAFVLAHDSIPPETVKPTDTALQTGVSFKF